MKYLISKGADVNARDTEDRTPLFWCAKYGKSFNLLNAKSTNFILNYFNQEENIIG